MIRQRGRAVSGAFAFLLLGVFAVFAVLLVLFGAQAYRGAVDHSARNNADRILRSFVSNAVLADDAEGAVTVEPFCGLDALNVGYTYDGERYIKRIYCYDGALRELFTDADSDAQPDEGEILCEADTLSLTMEENLITAVITDLEGRSHTAQIALRCGE